MRKGTSGVWVNESDNKIQIGYVDYGVSEFGGGDFECTYTLTDEHAIKFRSELAKAFIGPLKEAVRIVFGKNFDDNLFVKFCEKNGIKYSKSTWSSGVCDEMELTPDNQHDKMLELLEKLEKLKNEYVPIRDIEIEDNKNDT